MFAIAAVFGWAEVMKEAAWNTLSLPLRDLIVGQAEELHTLSAADYQALLQWRFACQDALDKLFRAWTQPFSRESSRTMALCFQSLLKETGCPRSAVLVNEDAPAKAFSIDLQNPSKSNSNSSYYKMVLQECKVMAAKMDEVVQKVCFNQLRATFAGAFNAIYRFP